MNADLLILDYEPAHQPAFRALNHEWIAHYFTIEPIDNDMLDDPEGYILAPDGHIFMASHGGAIVGTCALIKEHEGVYELAKMAVSPRAQGLGIERFPSWCTRHGSSAKHRFALLPGGIRTLIREPL